MIFKSPMVFAKTQFLVEALWTGVNSPAKVGKMDQFRVNPQKSCFLHFLGFCTQILLKGSILEVPK